MNQHDMTELVLTASDARDFPDYRQVVARVLLELNERVKSLELELAVLVEGTLSDPDAQSIRTLAQRVESLESRVREIVREEIAKNTGEGEVEHAASVSRSVSAKDASRATTPNNAEEGASAMRHGSGARPDATSLSTACPLCHGMLSEDECKKQNTPSPQGSTASAERSVRVDVVHANDGTPLMAAAHVAQPLTGGEGVPAWVPSVEEMAERLLNAQIKHYGLSPRAWAQVGEEERAYWLALARAAIGGGG